MPSKSYERLQTHSWLGIDLWDSPSGHAVESANVGSHADNPGLTLFHCHMQLHMDFGFMQLLEYAG